MSLYMYQGKSEKLPKGIITSAYSALKLSAAPPSSTAVAARC